MKRLNPSKPPVRQIKKLIVKKIQKALKNIDVADEESIHTLRKMCKEIRSLLRLLKTVLPKSERRAGNIWFRDTARSLSAVRNAQTFNQKASSLSKQQDPHAAQILKEHFDARINPIRLNALLEKTRARFTTALARINRWDMQSNHPVRDVIRGLTGTYRQSRRLRGVLNERSNRRAFHEWRKQVKYLSYQIDALASLSPKRLKKLYNELSQLSDDLGEIHDWTVLRQRIAEIPNIAGKDKTKIFQRIDCLIIPLQRKTLTLGGKIFKKSPKRFGKRMAQLWHHQQDLR